MEINSDSADALAWTPGAASSDILAEIPQPQTPSNLPQIIQRSRVSLGGSSVTDGKMARKKKRLERLPVDPIPYHLIRHGRPGLGRKMLAALADQSKSKPRVPPLVVKPKWHRDVRRGKITNMTTIVCWDLAPHVGYDQVRDLFKEISGVLRISFSTTKRCAVVHFDTTVAAQTALYQLTGCCLNGCPLKFAWFDKGSYDLNRDALPVMEILPGRVPNTVCVMGFDTSLSIIQIKSMIRSYFHLNRLRHGSVRIITPKNPDGTSIGKAFVSFQRQKDLVAALKRDGLDLGDGRKLCVTKWLELLSFPWHYKQKGGGSVGGGPASHVEAANWGTPSTGKRIVFETEF